MVVFLRLSFEAILLLCFIATGIEGLQVGFGEVDYRENERAGGVSVIVQKSDENVGNLVLTIQTLTYNEVDPSLRPVNIELPEDEAEYSEELNGRRDFARVSKDVTFAPSGTLDEQSVFLEFTDDEINEATEGFFALIRINEEESDPQDVANIKYIREGVTLLVIIDNDEIKLSFQDPQYTVNETDGVQKNLISIIKEDGRITEQTLEIFVQLSPLSGDGAAQRGSDFEITETKTVTLSPDQQMAFVPFEVLDDTVTEFRERLNLFLSIPEDRGVYSLGSIISTNVFINDNEVGQVGFESTVYTVTESVNQTAEVCLTIFDEEFEYFVFGNIIVQGNSAQDIIQESVLSAIERSVVRSSGAKKGSVDYFPPFTSDVFLDTTVPRQCFTITIIDDSVIETTENLTVTVRFEDSGSDLDFVVDPAVTSIVIIDDDEIPQNPCDLCGNNSECVSSGVESVSQCVCKQGYRGNGVQCDNINECSEGLDNCNGDADCLDLDGSYRCTCKAGYIGNGFICNDIDECRTGQNHCDQNAVCTNIPGSYRCYCKTGYTGNGFICKDIDECRTGQNNCDDNASCKNIPGRYECSCNSGYTGNGFICKDFDECRTGQNNCDDNAFCKNVPGSYECSCSSGYTGNGITCRKIQEEPTDVDECLSGTDNCSPHAVCENTVGSFVCTCKPGFTGDGMTCKNRNECRDGTHECDSHARCYDRYGSYKCVCKYGYKGDGRKCVHKSKAEPPADDVDETSSSDCGEETGTSRSRSTKSGTHTHTHTHSRSRSRSRSSHSSSGTSHSSSRSTSASCGDDSSSSTSRTSRSHSTHTSHSTHGSHTTRSSRSSHGPASYSPRSHSSH